VEAGASEQAESEVREVRNYVVALDHGIKMLAKLPLSLRLVREIHERLMKGVRGDSATPGEFRQPNISAIAASGTSMPTRSTRSAITRKPGKISRPLSRRSRTRRAIALRSYSVTGKSSSIAIMRLPNGQRFSRKAQLRRLQALVGRPE